MAEAMSKSAKQRAAKKAREAAAVETTAPDPVPAPAPAPAAAKSKAAAKSAPAAATPAAAPVQASPKGKPKAEAKAAPEPKASAKATAKSQPAPAAAKPAAVVAEPATGKKKKGGSAAPAPAPVVVAAPAVQPASKAATKGKAKAKAAPAPAPVPEPEDAFVVMDDGTGGEWGVAEGISKKGKKKGKTDDVVEAEVKPKNPLYKTAEAAGQQNGKGGKGGGKNSTEAAPRTAGSVSAMEALTKAVQAEAAARVAAHVQARPVPAEGEKADEPKAPQFSRTIEMAGDKIGRVIGPKGANIIKIQEHFEGKIARIDTSGGFCTISGEDEKAVESAEMAINELITKGFMSISYKDLKEDTVTIKSMFLPEIIGKQGVIIKKIKEVTNVEIDIPQEGKGGKGGSTLDDEDPKGKGKGGKGANDGKPVKIALVGEAEDVAKAKAIIEDICRNFCHPLIHVDHVHAAMEVDPDNHRYVIGRGGSEMRHIQKNWNVKVNLPKWDYNDGKLLSESENVIIVGEQHDVDRAKAYIEKILSNAAEDSKKYAEGAPAEKDKYDKDEEPVEAWMKPYMYKR